MIGLTEFEQYVDDRTDTVIYGFNKFVKLLLECNSNVCELLRLDEEQYMIRSGGFRMLSPGIPCCRANGRSIS